MPDLGYLAGRGIADITGEIAECGMLGYGMKHQQSAGLHLRLRARAFAFAPAGPAAPGEHGVLLVVCDLPLMFGTVVQDVLPRLPAGYDEAHVMITATHTHCGPGGYSLHALYNSNTGGFRPKTHAAIVDGIVEAATLAHRDLAPAVLTVGHGELHNASRNRSRPAFDRNPPADREFFPEAIDPQVTVLRIVRDGRAVAAVTWFATHGTSMTNQNRLVSGDNKGYAAYHWERLIAGVDYLDDPGFVAAFPQTNAGDMSPNLNGSPGSGPTGDQFTNTRIIGTRQYEAAAGIGGVPVTGPVEARLCHVDLGAMTVRPEFTGDGRPHRTSPPQAGASAWAGAWADGPAFKGFRPGRNPFWDAVSRYLIYPLAPGLKDAQAPKALTMPGNLISRFRPLVARRGPVQLLRIGSLYLLGVPGEVTIVAGLRLRRVVAAITGAPLPDVLCAGYSNGYLHYTTTPEEYDAQEYEGGSTLFGRWQLPALCQVAAELATAMRDGEPTAPGRPEPRPAKHLSKHAARLAADEPPRGRSFGDLLSVSRDGRLVAATFAAAHPGNDLRRGGTYLEIERLDGSRWRRVADDGDWSTKLHWTRLSAATSTVTVTWQAADSGTYRVRYHGTAASGPFTGVTEPIEL